LAKGAGGDPIGTNHGPWFLSGAARQARLSPAVVSKHIQALENWLGVRLRSIDNPWHAQAELLLAFWASIGFKPGDFTTTGMNKKRTVWLCRVLDRVTRPA
jgi:hypothetical protein